jgi:predicted RNase H-like HicB family nuclease
VPALKKSDVIVFDVKVSGGHIAGVTPVPIPNTEVKPRRADDTARVTVWERRSLPGLNLKGPSRIVAAGLFSYGESMTPRVLPSVLVVLNSLYWRATVKEKRKFTVLIEQDKDGYYVATVPALVGCHTQAKSQDVLMKRVREVIALCLEEEDHGTKPLELVGIQQVSV